MKALLSTLRHHLSPLLASPMSTFITTSLYNDPHIAFLHVHNALSLLDGYLLAGWSPQLEDDLAANQQELGDARDIWLSDGLIALGVYMETIGSTGADNDKTRECSLVTLRLLVGLTHSDKVWCAKLTKNEFCFGFILRAILRGHSTRLGKVKDEPETNGKAKREELGTATNGNGRSHGKQNGKRSVKVEETKKENSDEESEADDVVRQADGAEEALDTLCLALGLLTNLIQVDDEVKNTLRETYVSPHCTLPKCLTACRCPQQISALEALARVYKQLLPTPVSPHVKVESSPEPADPSEVLANEESQLLLSHLSLLFGLLMLDNTENQTVLLALLPSPASSSQYDGDSAKVDVLVEQAREFVYIYSGAEGGDAAEEGESVKTVLRFLETLRER